MSIILTVHLRLLYDPRHQNTVYPSTLGSFTAVQFSSITVPLVELTAIDEKSEGFSVTKKVDLLLIKWKPYCSIQTLEKMTGGYNPWASLSFSLFNFIAEALHFFLNIHNPRN